MSETPELAIVIIHHRTPGFLKMCLDSIIKTAQGINYELLVVDSKTTRQSRDIVLERTPNAIFLGFNENLGFGRGVNIGLANSRAPFILFLNPDVILTESSAADLLAFIKKHDDIGLAGPMLRNFDGSIQNSCFSFYKPMTILARRSFLSRLNFFKKYLDEFLMADTDHTRIQTPDWLMGSALMVSRNAANAVGPMDNRFFMYFEDVDWARRFWHNGYKVVYYPRSVMLHYHQQESKSRWGILDPIFNKKTRWHIRSAVRYFLKYRNLASVR